MIPAIVLSTHTVGLGVIRSLAAHGVPIHAFYYLKQEMGYVSRYVKHKTKAPNPVDNEDQFIDLLLSHAKTMAGSVLIPADDASLVAVSKHKDQLEHFYRTAFTDWEITKKYIEKKYSYELAASVGVPAPRTFLPANESDLISAARELGFPCLIKPCQSHLYSMKFQKKMSQVNDIDQMMDSYREANEAGIEVMLQEMIPGDDTSGANYNSFFWDGNLLVDFTAEKIRLAPPKYGVPRVLISKDLPELRQPGIALLKAFGYSGFSCMEFKRDARDGIYKFMEINGRINLSCLHAVKCGIDFPWLVYNHLATGKLPDPASFTKGVYWIDLSKDLVATLQHRKQEKYTWRQLLTPYFSPHIFAIFSLKDPLPFIKRMLNFAFMALESCLPAKYRNSPAALTKREKI